MDTEQTVPEVAHDEDDRREGDEVDEPGAPEVCKTGDVASSVARSYVVFEVLGGEVGNPEPRWGDWWTRRVVGLVSPYVQVEYIEPNGEVQREQTGVVKVALGQYAACKVNFDSNMVFQIDMRQREPHRIRIQVFHHRPVQGFISGDPLVGEATLDIDISSARTFHQRRLNLTRHGEGAAGPEPEDSWLNVQYRIVVWEAVSSTLALSGQHRLADVITAVANVLRGPDGFERLLGTRPRALAHAESDVSSNPSARSVQARSWISKGSWSPSADDSGHGDLKQLVDELCKRADAFSGHETEQEIIGLMRQLSRGILVYVATHLSFENDYCLSETTASITVAHAAEWIREFFAACARDQAASSGAAVQLSLNEARFRKFLMSGLINKSALKPVDENFQVVESGSWSIGKPFPDEAKLGSGAYGDVGRMQDTETKVVCAVKLMYTKSKLKYAVTVRECQVAEVLRDWTHPCIVKIFEVFHHRECKSCSLVMQFCSAGDLEDDISRRRTEGLYQASPLANEYVAQLFLALEFLHLDVGMMCRDVKPQNVLLSADRCRAMLTDFGMSRLDTSSDGGFSFAVPPGSPAYAAPEVIRGDGYDFTADFYSLGVLVLVLFSGGVATERLPMPPCSHFNSRQGLAGLLPLTRNWELVRDALLSGTPRRTPLLVQPIEPEPSREFILKLTDRGEGYDRLSHQDVRGMELLQHQCQNSIPLPPRGDALDTERWLTHIVKYGADRSVAS